MRWTHLLEGLFVLLVVGHGNEMGERDKGRFE
jgi:hypothetical protein